MEEIDFNPSTNENAIAIIRQEDGNYKGYAQKFGKLIEVRTGDPQSALVALITHG
jgi:hypothetical protein